ncbi:MAG: class I SAM-dependent DNA methyltransferase [Rubrobacteraceae bacterium]|nr:class I SAM-dependent DNA methyltransferase [Rubrobacteraceae bacterium]
MKKTGVEAGKGFADVWYRGHFAFEYKGKHKDLEAAYDQLLRYREDLGNPPLLVVCDIDRFQVHTNFTNTAKRVYAFTNEELPEPENLRVLRALFEAPASLAPERTSEGVTEEAARKFAQLADGLRSRGVDSERASHFLNKLLFCLFAEDVGLLPEGLFTKIISRTRRNPERFAQYAGQLFNSMSEGGDFLLEDIPCFNGGLFADGDTLPLEDGELQILADATKLDWGSVEPAIFGTLFERSLDPGQRARLGAHYTSREDILTLVEPVLMAPLRREWARVQEESEKLFEGLHPTNTASRNRTLRKIEAGLIGYLQRLRTIRVLDPACGSGNFLYVSLKQLLDLEKEVSTFAEKLGIGHFFPEVSPEQLWGIETSPYAHELAQVVVWIGYLQWMVDNGFGTRQEPILGPMTNILWMDAILGYDEGGRPVEPEWPEADVIVGNPPFLGGSKVRGELGDEYIGSLWELYKGQVPGFADLVCYWFEKTRQQIEKSDAVRAGLLATNSIRGGVNRRVLERIKQSGDIYFAESDRAWILNGAAVRVSMVGFDQGAEKSRICDGVPVDTINADLTGTVDLTSTEKLEENRGLCFFSIKKGGPFDVTGEVARRWLELPANPNNRPNSDVVKPWYNGIDVARRPRDMWIVDFGPDRTEQEATLYEAPFEHVYTYVKPIRDENRRERRRRIWWLFSETAPGMRRALAGLPRFLATPAVSTHRLLVWIDAAIVPDQQLIVFARDDDYFFGVLHSRAHELWSLRMGTSLEDRPRYTPTTCFETFPLPWPPREELVDDPVAEEISAAAKRLDELRRNWLNPEGITEAEQKKRTLTNLYNARPAWLQNAHDRLDRAVFAAYGWPSDISDEDILTNLLTLNQERSKVQAQAGS